MIENPDQVDSLSMPRRDWVRVAAALAMRAERDSRLQPLVELFHTKVQSWQRRAPVNAGQGRPVATISWEEHVEAWQRYAMRYGTAQSCERIAERGGFGMGELRRFLGREPDTYEPTDPSSD